MSFDPNEPDVWGRTGQAKVDAAKQRGENVPEGFDYSRFDLSKALDTQGPSMPNLFPTSPASYSGSDTSPSHYSELDISPSRYSRSDTSPPSSSESSVISGIALSFFIVILAFFFGGLQAALTLALLILGLWLAFLLLKLVFTLVRAILSFVFSWKGVLLGCFAFGGFFILGALAPKDSATLGSALVRPSAPHISSDLHQRQRNRGQTTTKRQRNRGQTTFFQRKGADLDLFR